MASFPGAVKAFTTRNPGDTIASAHIDDLQDEVNAIEAGYLNGTAQLNSSHSTLATLSVLGNSTLASSVTFGSIAYVFPASAPITGATLTCTSSGTPNVLGWSGGPNGLQLITAASGSDTSAGATDLSSASISGLTAKDQLWLTYSVFPSSQAVGSVTIRHQTDGVDLAVIGAVTANRPSVGEVLIMQDQTASTTVLSVVNGYEDQTDRGGSTRVSVTTAWTAAWSLALRHGGVTAGGTAHWRWAVYKLTGQ